MRPRSVVWAGSALYALVYFLLGWDRYATYHSGADLGLFVQVMSSAFAEGGFVSTLEGANHFTYHFSPILYAFAPFLIAARSPLVLIALQAIAGALVAPGLYALAVRRCAPHTALAVAAIGWVYPPLAGITFTDFHENGFVPAATVWLLWALDARRLPIAALLAAVLLATKEDQGLILATVGAGAALVFARRGERPRALFGAGLAIVSLATFVFYFMVVRHLAGATTPWDPLHFYALGVPSRGPTTPLFSFGRLTYLLEAFAPLLFLPLLAPLVLTTLPGFAECLLSHESLTYTMGQHYAAVWIGYILSAYAVAAVRVRPALRIAAIAASVVVLAVASPTHWAHFLRLPARHDAVLDRFVSAIPSDVTVGTHDEIYAHLGFVPGAQIGLRGPRPSPPQFALFDEHYHSTAWVQIVRPQFEELLKAGVYRVVRSEDGVILAQKTAR
ncbi:MAG: DUF2079 domain-containing protein [Candidatus Eremiobacteraeota bacterium]|nr:DUF2079 domain-containing protein [Candidatus Eremiobacteraeota bacterium]